MITVHAPNEETVAQLHEAFLQAEEDLGLFDVAVRGVPAWEWIRFQAFHEVLLVAKGLHEPPRTPVRRTPFNAMRILLRSLLDIRHNPYRVRPTPVLFVGHPRRKQQHDGTWWDLYCDPLLDAVPMEALSVEFLLGDKHRAPCPTRNLRYMDLFSIQMRWRAWRYGPVLRGEAYETWRELSRRLGAALDCEIDLCGLIERYMKVRFCGLEAYKKWLNRIRPHVVFLVVSYGREVLVTACRELGIPVVELQHGSISPHHCAYAYPPHRTKHSFPDYFFCWGAYWKKTPFPLPADRVKVTGFPFLEMEKQAVGGVDRKDQVLFISQPTIGRELSRLAVETAQSIKPGISIIYKLHPGEYGSWREQYPWLVPSQVQVIDDDRTSTSRLLAGSTTLVGVYSTAVLEGLALGCHILLADLPGVEAYADLIRSGAARRIQTAADICREGTQEDVETDKYFNPNWKKGFVDALEQIGLGHILKT